MKPSVRYRTFDFKMLIFLGILNLIVLKANAQDTPQSYLQYEGLPIGETIFENDTIPVFMLKDVAVVQKIIFKNERQKHQYTKLVRDLKKTLPYARLCRDKVAEMEYKLSLIPDEKDKENFLDSAEKELFNEFEKPLRKLTFNQGRLLIKLVDRETGDTTYDLIKDLKGNFSAFLWQSVARMFGSNLKSEYSADGEDSKIESIIYLIDAGVY